MRCTKEKRTFHVLCLEYDTTDLVIGLFAYLFILFSCSSLHYPNQLMLLLTPHI